MDYRRDLVAGQNHLGNFLIATDRPKEAEFALRAAADISGQLISAATATAKDRHLFAGTCQNLGNFLFKTDRIGPAEEYYVKARDQFQKLVDDFPEQTDYRRDQAQHFGNLGVLYAVRGGSHMEEAFRSSCDAIQKLTDEYPNRPEYRMLLAIGRANLGNLLTRLKRYRPADEVLQARRLRGWPTSGSGGTRATWERHSSVWRS